MPEFLKTINEYTKFLSQYSKQASDISEKEIDFVKKQIVGNYLKRFKPLIQSANSEKQLIETKTALENEISDPEIREMTMQSLEPDIKTKADWLKVRNQETQAREYLEKEMQNFSLALEKGLDYRKSDNTPVNQKDIENVFKEAEELIKEGNYEGAVQKIKKFRDDLLDERRKITFTELPDGRRVYTVYRTFYDKSTGNRYEEQAQLKAEYSKGGLKYYFIDPNDKTGRRKIYISEEEAENIRLAETGGRRDYNVKTKLFYFDDASLLKEEIERVTKTHTLKGSLGDDNRIELPMAGVIEVLEYQDKNTGQTFYAIDTGTTLIPLSPLIVNRMNKEKFYDIGDREMPNNFGYAKSIYEAWKKYEELETSNPKDFKFFKPTSEEEDKIVKQANEILYNAILKSRFAQSMESSGGKYHFQRSFAALPLADAIRDEIDKIEDNKSKQIMIKYFQDNFYSQLNKHYTYLYVDERRYGDRNFENKQNLLKEGIDSSSEYLLRKSTRAETGSRKDPFWHLSILK